ncbi:hypothetical protein BDW02DRAFT_93018 [Decorospora gaudefroyi]|uniref:Uncharacterized protein n=1 Tax=Decorospora gaudefroyi TaxID=184978 RepID=A0A6A5K834_9PLEO|nr:hypothetical protein BDW02DRAFT_93018 [Decorospora gaudefroyi]
MIIVVAHTASFTALIIFSKGIPRPEYTMYSNSLVLRRRSIIAMMILLIFTLCERRRRNGRLSY